jgi:hypothetical protein
MTPAQAPSGSRTTNPAAPAQKQAGRTAWLAAILLGLAIVSLHVWLWRHAGAFCGDEVQVINLSKLPSVAAMTHDSFPILLPMLLRGWTALGGSGSDLELRLLGCLIGVGVAAGLWLVAWRGARAVPWISLALFALNGTIIYWTDYLRAYGLGSLLILLTFAAMCHFLERPSWARTAILAVAAVLSVQALYQNAVFFAAIGFGGWAVCAARRDLAGAVKILAAAVAGAASLLPYLGPLHSWQQATTIRPGFSWAAAWNNLETVLAFPAPLYVWIWASLALTVLVWGSAAWFQGAASAPAGAELSVRERRILAAVVLLVSALGYLLFLKLAALITSPWYFVPLLAVTAAGLDLALADAITSRRWRTVAAGVWVGTVGLSNALAARDLNCRYSNMDLVANRLGAEVSPEDYVVVTPWYLGISFQRYYHSRASWDSMPPIADHSAYRFDLVPVTAQGMTEAMRPVYERAAAALEHGHRVWVVGWMAVPPPGRRAATEAGRFLAEHSTSFAAVDLRITGQTSDYENVSLLEAQGWRAPSP